MIDVDKVKPGDKVVYIGTDPVVRAKGIYLTVCDPATISRDIVYVSANFIDGTHAICKPKNLEFSYDVLDQVTSPESHPPCTCELWFGNGCTCGQFVREREAKANG